MCFRIVLIFCNEGLLFINSKEDWKHGSAEGKQDVEKKESISNVDAAEKWKREVLKIRKKEARI